MKFPIATEFGVAVDLHAGHIDPLLKVVRDAKHACAHEADASVFREIEYRLDKARPLVKCSYCGDVTHLYEKCPYRKADLQAPSRYGRDR